MSTLDTSVSNQLSTYINSLEASTLSFLIFISVAIVFTNVSFECDKSFYSNETKDSNNKKCDNVDFERIARTIIETQLVYVSIILDNIKLKNMSMNQVVTRLKKIIDLVGRAKQVEAIYIVGCLRQSLILLARTSFGKSLIFNVLSLLHSIKTSVVLIVVSLKLISEQQVNRVKNYNRGRPFVYDVDHNSRLNRLDIAIDCYTYDKFCVR